MLNSADVLAAVPNYDPYIGTSQGNRFYIFHPEFDIVDIAHSLSRQCRFTGHTKRFYSIAEHSCLVHSIMGYFDLGSQLEGLMHDAQEAYLADIASPFKALLPDYKALEKRIELPLRKWQGLPDYITEGCKKADWIALVVEAQFLMPSKGDDWDHVPEGIRDMRDEFIAKGLRARNLGWDVWTAHNNFMERYRRAKEPISL